MDLESLGIWLPNMLSVLELLERERIALVPGDITLTDVLLDGGDECLLGNVP